MSPRFYYPALPDAGGPVDLPAALSHHAVTVLRMQPGEALVLFDGHGREAAASVIEARKQALRVACEPPVAIDRENALQITLVQALPSGDKMDWIVEKCTELGIAAIQPIQATRSVVKLQGERAEKKQQRWQDIAIAACAQCGRNVAPTILPVQSCASWLSTPPKPGLHLLLDLAPDIPRLSQLDFTAVKSAAITVMVGPEGAFTDEEISQALAAGFQAVNLGRRILRTETAGVAFLAAVNTLLGDF
ncbi:MAG: 16S rRNA (uracil(1498)-N(3))-methyltransferase [Burkholderiaceae bacterium]|nr:MAG: 16S rRNA (uracil(1498)-N(3))-methyltransferase [Burkholderiaceae bacterium]